MYLSPLAIASAVSRTHLEHPPTTCNFVKGLVDSLKQREDLARLASATPSCKAYNVGKLGYENQNGNGVSTLCGVKTP
jgi:hypothetical protein